MTTTVAKLYADAGKAAAAVKDLKNIGYGDSDIVVCAPAGVATAEETASGLAQAGVPAAHATAYAAEVKKGATLVMVRAAFGAGARTTATMDKHGPSPSPAAVAAIPAARTAAGGAKSATTFDIKPYDDPAPLSAMMQWKTLSSDSTPLSSFLNWPTLSDFSFSRKFGFAELSDDAAPLSKKFGWQLLRDNDPTPLSTKFNWPVLRD